MRLDDNQQEIAGIFLGHMAWEFNTHRVSHQQEDKKKAVINLSEKFEQMGGEKRSAARNRGCNQARIAGSKKRQEAVVDFNQFSI